MAQECEFCEGVVEHRQIRARFHYMGGHRKVHRITPRSLDPRQSLGVEGR